MKTWCSEKTIEGGVGRRGLALVGWCCCCDPLHNKTATIVGRAVEVAGVDVGAG